MKRKWMMLPALAVLALVISVAWWLLGRAAWRPAPPLKPDLPQVASLATPPRVLATQARERPLMWPSRRPAEKNDDKTDAKSSAGSELAQSRLMAVLESGPRRVALLQKPDGSALKISTVEPDGTWKMDSFDGAVAVFVSRTGEKVERPLERVAAPAAPGQPRPGARPAGPAAARPAASGTNTPAGPNAPSPRSAATPATSASSPAPSLGAASTASAPTTAQPPAAPPAGAAMGGGKPLH